MAVARESWIETLTACGLPEVRRIHATTDVDRRLTKATRLAVRVGLMAREGLVEIIAGTCNGAAGDRLGSTVNPVAAADAFFLEKST